MLIFKGLNRMTDKIRCPSCRGSKKVPKLGGMIGDCNTCNGEGSIQASDKPIAVVAEIVEPVKELINQVAECLPVSDIEPVKDVKIDAKRAVFKRKKTA